MKNKTLFVTGGNEGIGLATALLFAEQGVNVAIMGRRADRNARARDAISAKGVKSIAITGDVSSGAAMSDAVKQVLDTFGGLHFAFNNAGVSDVPTPFVQSTEADYDRLMGINLKGIWLAMKYELPAIAVSGGGSIVNTGSNASIVGMPMLPLYVASKHGVLGLTKSAALEYAKLGVRVNAVCPGVTADTGMFNSVLDMAPEFEKALLPAIPMGRCGRPHEIAHGVLYLCSEAASYVTGQGLQIDGGFTVP